MSIFSVLIIPTIKRSVWLFEINGLDFLQVAAADEVVKTIINHMTDSSNKSHLSLKSGKILASTGLIL